MQNSSRILLAGLLMAASVWSAAHAAEIPAEFQVKRAEAYEFASPPSVTRSGDRIEISFESKADCDATVAIEDADGKIVRHLASGVLGKTAPEPFQKDTLAQKIVWDGKDDAGKYIDDKDSHTVRVSLGLKPQLDRTLFWSPHKRLATTARGPYACPAPEGVYVMDGEFEDHLRLFDHEGSYVRTVYPFPGDKIESVQGLTWFDYPQGYRLPVKTAVWKQTLLTSGQNALKALNQGNAASAMAVQAGRIALAEHKLNRIATDGTSGGLPLQGGATALIFTDNKGKEYSTGPRSVAFSPDGKKLYMTGYRFDQYNWFHAVMVLDYDSQEPAKVFAGSTEEATARSTAGGKDFKAPTGVACDSAGRVYVADHGNDRIQVYTPDGKLFKSIAVNKPTEVKVDPKTGEIHVFSWLVYCRFMDEKKKTLATLTRFGPVEKPEKKGECPVPLEAYIDGPSMWLGKSGNLQFCASVDFWTSPPTYWVTIGASTGSQGGVEWFEWGRSLRLFQEEKGNLVQKQDFAKMAKEKVGRLRPPSGHNQRLHVNPADGMLYVAEGDTGCLAKDFSELLRLDPATGKMAAVKVPFGAEDTCFDLEGNIYLRTTTTVTRFAFPSWREVPWDYGEERGKYMSMLILPSSSPVCYHQGGLDVNAKGHLVVACSYRFAGDNLAEQKWDNKQINPDAGGKKYTPIMWPGRSLGSTTAFAHVWDKHGQVLHEDAVPGMPQVDGIGIDAADNIFIMATPTRILGGKRYFNELTETVMKFQPGKGRFVSASSRCQVPLQMDARPKRDADADGGNMNQVWVEGSEWFYGGVGFAGFNGGPACACVNVRFSLDLFGRSFAPENDQYRVAVLDPNGNLILRVGQYGNIDDGKPLVADGGPPATRSIGGDEVALMHPRFVASYTDRYLFVADYGNACIRSVKLGYHSDRRVALKDVPETAKE